MTFFIVPDRLDLLQNTRSSGGADLSRQSLRYGNRSGRSRPVGRYFVSALLLGDFQPGGDDCLGMPADVGLDAGDPFVEGGADCSGTAGFPGGSDDAGLQSLHLLHFLKQASMSDWELQDRREEMARREAGHTLIRPALSRGLMVFFLLVILTVPLVQHIAEFSDYTAGKGVLLCPGL